MYLHSELSTQVLLIQISLIVLQGLCLPWTIPMLLLIAMEYRTKTRDF